MFSLIFGVLLPIPMFFVKDKYRLNEGEDEDE
jgi:hypothetical protein